MINPSFSTTGSNLIWFTFSSNDISLKFKLIIAWGISDFDMDSKNIICYHLRVKLELTEDYRAKFWQVRLNNNWIEKKIWTDHKRKKVRQKLDTIFDRTRTAKKFTKNLLRKCKQKITSKDYKTIFYVINIPLNYISISIVSFSI